MSDKFVLLEILPVSYVMQAGLKCSINLTRHLLRAKFEVYCSIVHRSLFHSVACVLIMRVQYCSVFGCRTIHDLRQPKLKGGV